MAAPRSKTIRRNTPHDARRVGVPRDYIANPAAFGRPGTFQPAMPPGGDAISQRLALLQHTLASAWHSAGRKLGSRHVTQTWGLSRQTWSDTLLGKRWAGMTGIAALIATPPPSQ